MMTAKVLGITNLSVRFNTLWGPVHAVDGIDFNLYKGRTFVVLGESGCGKSMTALAIMGLLPKGGYIASGSVLLDGQDLVNLSEHEKRTIRGGRIAMIFQEPQSSLNPVMPVGQQIAESVKLHLGLNGEAQLKKVLELMDAVGIADRGQRYHEYPHQFSGGMKQRIMIAMALAGKPDVLIADEPTTALDVTIQSQVLALLKSLQQEWGMAIMLITHDLGVVAEMADTVAVMYAGHLVEQADRSSFFNQPVHPYSQKLFDSLPSQAKRGQHLTVIPGGVPSLRQTFTGCRFTARCEYSWQTCLDIPPVLTQISPSQTGRCHLLDPQYKRQSHVQNIRPPQEVVIEKPASESTPLLVVNGLNVYFPIVKGFFRKITGYVRAVDNVSLSLQKSQTLALVGESGCGKTTLGKAILRLIEPTAGQVQFADQEVNPLDAAGLRNYRAKAQFIFQDPFASLNPRMQIGQIIEEGMLAQGIGQTDQRRKNLTDKLLIQVGLNPDLKYRYPHEFSGGQRQRICIARALAVQPQLIVCDEPTSALDVSVQAQILNLLKDLQDQLGLAYLFITHNISVVEYLAHYVAVMYLGKIVEYGLASEVLQNPLHPYTQALLSAVPEIHAQNRRAVIRLEGDIPSPAAPPAGCYFQPRCRHAKTECRMSYPSPTQVSPTHTVSCVLLDSVRNP